MLSCCVYCAVVTLLLYKIILCLGAWCGTIIRLLCDHRQNNDDTYHHTQYIWYDHGTHIMPSHHHDHSIMNAHVRAYPHHYVAMVRRSKKKKTQKQNGGAIVLWWRTPHDDDDDDDDMWDAVVLLCVWVRLRVPLYDVRLFCHISYCTVDLNGALLCCVVVVVLCHHITLLFSCSLLSSCSSWLYADYDTFIMLLLVMCCVQ